MFWFLHAPALNLLCGHWPCAHCMRYVQLCMWWSCLDNSLCHSGLCTCVHTLVSTHATNASLQYQPHAHCIAICNCSICIQSMHSGIIHICVMCPWSCLRLTCLQCFLQLLLAFKKIVSAGNSDWGLTWQPPVSLKLLIIFLPGNTPLRKWLWNGRQRVNCNLNSAHLHYSAVTWVPHAHARTRTKISVRIEGLVLKLSNRNGEDIDQVKLPKFLIFWCWTWNLKYQVNL